MATRLSPTLSRRNTPSPARSSEMKRELAGLRLRYRAQAQRLPGDAHLTGRVEREPRQRAHDLDGAGPDLPGKTDHRATRRDEIEILDERRDAEALDHQHRPAHLPVSARIHLGHAATEHHPHQLRAVDLIRTPGADQLPVAQNRNRITELKHLAEPVRNVDDGFAFRLERPQRIEDALDLDIGQRCRGLVEDEHRASRVSIRASSTSCRRPMLSCDIGVSSERSPKPTVSSAARARSRSSLRR